MRSIKRSLRFIYTRFFMILFLPLRIRSNKIVIANMYGKGFGDNGKSIYKELKTRKIEYEIVWLVNKHYDDMPKDVRQVKHNSIKSFYELATARIWIDNHRKDTGIIKKKRQIYIQTWHSSLRLKRIEKEAEDYLPRYYIRKAKHDSKMIDILTCGSDFSRKTYEESFWYGGKIEMTGSPRYDEYFIPLELSERQQIEAMFKIKKHKVILYAPTFRKNNPDFCGKMDFAHLNEWLKAHDAMMLIRLHPNSNAKVKEYSNIKNASAFPSLQNLIKYCELIITDYSGLCFDSLIMKKPCVLYVPDLDDYLKTERQLCFKISELPFLKIRQQDELEQILVQKNHTGLTVSYKSFAKKVGLHEDGKSSKRICDTIEAIVSKND